MIEVQRVEKHIIKSKHILYDIIDDYCFKTKNLYNYANYLMRQEFINTGKIIREYDLSKMCQPSDCYKELMGQTAQQTIKLLSKNWKSFLVSIKDWSKNKSKYTGRPKLPKYKHKTNGRYIAVFTNQNCKFIDGGYIKFPKVFNQYLLPTKIHGKLQQVRIIPRNNHYVIEVVYKIAVANVREGNGRYMSVDIGLDNLATIVTNTGIKPVVLNGKGLKSINKYYNKQKAHYQEVAKRMNDLHITNRLTRITNKRNNMIDDLMHKASKRVLDLALENDISVIVIGNNKDWKRESNMSKKVNQSFVGIPHQRFIEMVKYKAENVGIKVVLTEESYTSGTSFLDYEKPIKENYNKSRRIFRGLFVSNNGIKINADVNGAYQIMKKVFPNAFVDGIEDVGLHPIRVTIK